MSDLKQYVPLPVARCAAVRLGWARCKACGWRFSPGVQARCVCASIRHTRVAIPFMARLPASFGVVCGLELATWVGAADSALLVVSFEVGCESESFPGCATPI
eukprot:4667012-Prymnesium_polylepis.1